MSGWESYNNTSNPWSDSLPDADWLHDFDFGAFLDDPDRNDVRPPRRLADHTIHQPHPFSEGASAVAPNHTTAASHAREVGTSPARTQQQAPAPPRPRSPPHSHTATFEQPHEWYPRPSSALLDSDPLRPHRRDHRLANNNNISQVSPFGYVPDQLFEDSDEDANGTFDSSEFQDLPDLTSEHEEDEETMPPVTRRRNSSVFDLTGEQSFSRASASSSSQTRGLKRSAESPKRGRSKRARAESVKDEEPEEVDLTSEEALQQTQLLDAVQSQQRNNKEHEGPVKMGKRTCIICMDNYTNATVTTCGHIYCHECLIQALNASAKSNDRNMGSCPACRKRLHAPSTKKSKDQIIPIAFMKKSAFKGKAKRSG